MPFLSKLNRLSLVIHQESTDNAILSRVLHRIHSFRHLKRLELDVQFERIPLFLQGPQLEKQERGKAVAEYLQIAHNIGTLHLKTTFNYLTLSEARRIMQSLAVMASLHRIGITGGLKRQHQEMIASILQERPKHFPEITLFFDNTS